MPQKNPSKDFQFLGNFVKKIRPSNFQEKKNSDFLSPRNFFSFFSQKFFLTFFIQIYVITAKNSRKNIITRPIRIRKNHYKKAFGHL